jgi:hypothetical protein
MCDRPVGTGVPCLEVVHRGELIRIMTGGVIGLIGRVMA